MEANFNTTGTVNQGVATSIPVRTEKATTESVAPTVQSLKEMKTAEYKGEHIPISEEQLIKAIDRAIKAAEGSATSLEFSIHAQTKQIMVKVLEKDTGRVIREIPPEKTMDMVANLWKMAGILVDEKR
ncbi:MULTISPECIES: flagellar protein FlaG [unclassified Paenibacillus]|uniref:flagellar protein FlaG n=1 Tax=unclassified Paenibacillus TaxID=185978 RepID=UPI003640C678